MTAPFVDRLPVATVPGLEPIRLHRATPGSGLGRLVAAAPYWAYLWAGGLALAHHLRAHPEIVAGRRVLDIGAGSGLVAIAAALAGAHEVYAADVDAQAQAATARNAALNDVTVRILDGDPIGGDAVPPVDLILVGDLFYEEDLARRVTAFLDRVSVEAFVGDPGRRPLPLARLEEVARYEVSETPARTAPGIVYRFRPPHFSAG